MDLKRDKSLRYVSNLTPRERGNAVARIGGEFADRALGPSVADGAHLRLSLSRSSGW